MLDFTIDLMEQGLLPDPMIRWGIRRLCRDRLTHLELEAAQKNITETFAVELKNSSVAFATNEANQQHYEVPARFFELVLGPHRKYSCAYWPENCESLEQAEAEALNISMQRAELKDGQKILELGCGWGSLSLAMAKRFPNAKITAVSNSNSQRESIMARAKLQGLTNLEVLTRDLSVTEDLGDGRGNYDRIVSVEMFEHLRNYQVFFERLRKWLKPDGKMFVHVFTHKEFAYPFETEGSHNWMGKYFFTGGQMPSRSLFTHFQKDLTLKQVWDWSGEHYQKTSEAWLANMDRHEAEIRHILLPVYGEKEVDRWIQRWRVFFLACAELFGFKNGTEWGVNHYLFEAKSPTGGLQ